MAGVSGNDSGRGGGGRMTMHTKAAARYRPGQAPAKVTNLSESESDEEEDDAMNVKIKKEQKQPEVSVRKDGLIIKNEGVVASSTAPKLSISKVTQKVNKVKKEEEDVVDIKKEPSESEGSEETEEEESESEEFGESSSEEESSSSEEEPKIPLFKPKFISKENRETIAERERLAALGMNNLAGLEENEEDLEQRREKEMEKRKREAQQLVSDSKYKELAEKEAKESFPEDVDHTDGVDPDAEFEEWRLRALKRFERDIENRRAREKEQEEIQKRRDLPEELRFKEDMEYAEQTRREREAQREQRTFMQKFHHKGAFYTDDDVMKRSMAGATEGTITNMASLPKVMQVRNFGLASRTKYTHLADQDTSRPQNNNKGGGSGRTCFQCGGDHLKRDCPQLTQQERGGDSRSRSGRREGDPDRDESGGRGRRSSRRRDAEEEARLDQEWREEKRRRVEHET